MEEFETLKVSILFYCVLIINANFDLLQVFLKSLNIGTSTVLVPKLMREFWPILKIIIIWNVESYIKTRSIIFPPPQLDLGKTIESKWNMPDVLPIFRSILYGAFIIFLAYCTCTIKCLRHIPFTLSYQITRPVPSANSSHSELMCCCDTINRYCEIYCLFVWLI